MKNRRKKSGGFSFAPFLLLLPALFLGAYGLVYSYGYIPDEVDLGALTVEFFAMGENALMVFLAKLCFVWLPILFAVVLVLGLIIGRAMGNKAESGADGKEKNADSAKKKSGKDGKSGSKKAEKRGGGVADYLEDFPEEIDSSDSEEGGSALDFSILTALERNADRRERKNREYPAVLLKDVAEDVTAYARSKGINIPARAARSLIASVSSGRMLVTEERYKERSHALFDAVSSYFGGNVHPYVVDKGCYAPEHLTTVADADKRITETLFLVDIYSACLNSEKLSFASLHGLDPVAAPTFFFEYKAALESGSAERYVTVDKLRRAEGLTYIKDGKVLFPENLILTVSLTLGSDVTRLCEEAIYPELSGITPCHAEPYNGGGTVLRPQLIKALERAREGFYLSDEHWSGIDSLEEYLVRFTGRRFGNRKTRLMERYSSAYMAAGGSEAEALDSMLVACVICELYARRERFSERTDVEALPDVLERLFGAETVPASIEMARRICGIAAKPVMKTEESAVAVAEPKDAVAIISDTDGETEERAETEESAETVETVETEETAEGSSDGDEE